jgi:alpha-L-fucosidase
MKMINKTMFIAACFFLFTAATNAQPGIDSPVPSTKPGKYQKQQIKRKYGMFIHFGINTFHNEEWTDGSKPASTYRPTSIDARQWVETAKKAGMKYIILVSKHHEGFCLWDRKQNADTKDASLDEAYNKYMIGQLNELMDITGKYTKIVELWLDGSWEKPSYRWPFAEIYQTIKRREPQCQIGINWSIGEPDRPSDPVDTTLTMMAWYQPILPDKQKEGDPIRYFPGDFRLGDPYLPAKPDPKLFTHQGKTYYMPWESTVCMSERWFYHTDDVTYKSIDELIELYAKATAQDNILILNCPPNRDGKMRDKDIEILVELRKKINQ